MKKMKRPLQIFYCVLLLILAALAYSLASANNIAGLVIFIVILMILLVWFCWCMLRFALDPHFKLCMINFSDYTTERTYPDFIKGNTWYVRYAEKTSLSAKDGSRLYGSYVMEPDNKNKPWVIILHGYGNKAYDAMSTFSYGFHNLGFHVLCPIARGHEPSEGKYVTMGWKEKDDILDWIEWIEKKDPGAQIVLFGISMGGAAVMMASPEVKSRVAAIIEDCGYSNVYDQYVWQAHTLFGLPPFPVLTLCNQLARIMLGFSLKEADTLKQLRQSDTPTLFIHGKKDRFVPYAMQQVNYEACAAKDKQLLSVEDAMHGESVYKDPKLYWKTIEDFCQKHLDL